MLRSYRWLVVTLVILAAATCFGQLAISVQIGPPPLPVYRQPLCPAYGYIWTPGYWAWGDDGYYWVPGTWVLAPEHGYLWTPGYWAFSDGFYRWNPGYWALEIGFYGGIDYGYGYPGNGYYGGRWRGDHFYYNRVVNNVNVTNIHYVYSQRVVNNVTVQHVSYNGGPGGIPARPTAAQTAAERGHHLSATSLQLKHEQAAKADRRQFASVNHGRPPVAATPKPANFKAATVPATNKPTFHAPNKTASKAGSHPPTSSNKAEPARTTNNVPHPEKQSPAPRSDRVNTSHPEPAPKTNARTAASPHEATPPHAAPPPHETAPKEAAPAHEARPTQPVQHEASHPEPSSKTNARTATPPPEAAPPHAVPPPHETAPKEAAPAHEARPTQPVHNEASHPEPSPKMNAGTAAPPHEAAPPHAAPPPHETAPKEAAPAHEARPTQPKEEEKKPDK